jgi:ABC-2 type transport system permease protein
VSSALTIARKEFAAFFKTPVAYIVLCAFLILTGWFFFSDYFLEREASLRQYFGMLPLVFAIFAPAISMRMWAEERKVGTFETLMTMPVTDVAIVVGKFLAALGLIGVMLLCSLPTAFLVGYTSASAIDLGPIVGGYLGALFLGGTYLAMGLFASALTENQIVGFILGVVLALFFFFIGLPNLASVLPNSLAEVLRALSVGSHFDNIGKGVIDSRDVFYYLSMIVAFLMANVAAVRWR